MSTPPDITHLSVAEIEELLEAATKVEAAAHKTNALLWYEPAQPMLAHAHTAQARIVGVFGGNRSGKSEFGAIETAILATGIIPKSLQGIYPREKLRGDTRRGVRLRVVGVDFVNSVAKNLIPKFRDGDDHHGPWIPQACLEGGWEKAWSEKERTLTVRRDLHWAGGNRLTDWAKIEFMSYDQDIPRFSGVSRHFTWFDELPPYEVWKECQMRHVDVGGRSVLTLTPPDTTGDIAWLFDTIYEVGQPNHPKYAPERIQCFTIHTENNKFLPRQEVEDIKASLSPEEQEVRLHGAFRHLSGLVYPQFRAIPSPTGLCHVVEPVDLHPGWPVVMAVDPHPRTPWAVLWVAVDPHDTLWAFDELWGGGDTVESYANAIRKREECHAGRTTLRIIDPAANQTSNLLTRGFSIRTELDKYGIRCREAVNDFPSGRSKFLGLLRDGPLGPRLRVFRTCSEAIYQLTHHIWDEYSTATSGKDPKQTPQERNKHFPDLFRYLAQEDLRYSSGIRIQPGFTGAFRGGGGGGPRRGIGVKAPSYGGAQPRVRPDRSGRY